MGARRCQSVTLGPLRDTERKVAVLMDSLKNRAREDRLFLSRSREQAKKILGRNLAGDSNTELWDQILAVGTMWSSTAGLLVETGLHLLG